MNASRHWLPVVLGASLVFGMQSFAGEDAHEKSVRLSEVPAPAMEAAQKTLGVKPTEAKLLQGTTPQQYELEAKDKSGKRVAVHVQADGTVVKTESGADKD